jgi:hypothetical protein
VLREDDVIGHMEEPTMPNLETERLAIAFVMERERAAGREPVDVHLAGNPYDVWSPPRKIEVKAFGGSARGAPVPLEVRQVAAAREDPENFYLYVVDNVARADLGDMTVRVIHGDLLLNMIDSAKAHVTYWPTFRVAVYDSAEQLGGISRPSSPSRPTVYPTGNDPQRPQGAGNDKQPGDDSGAGQA